MSTRTLFLKGNTVCILSLHILYVEIGAEKWKKRENLSIQYNITYKVSSSISSSMVSSQILCSLTSWAILWTSPSTKWTPKSLHFILKPVSRAQGSNQPGTNARKKKYNKSFGKLLQESMYYFHKINNNSLNFIFNLVSKAQGNFVSKQLWKIIATRYYIFGQKW